MPDLSDLLPDENPESRVDLVEAMLGIALALIVAPGVIWWAGTLIDIASVTLETFR